jgi:hypothetical protein
MGALTSTVLMNLESRMSVIAENEYKRLTDNKNLWWKAITRTRTTEVKKDIVTWLLSTAQISDEGKGGNIRFEDLVSQLTTIEHGFSGAALKLRRDELEDMDGGGFDLAAQWSADVGAQMIYYPQKQAADFLKRGHTTAYTAYDGKPYFAVDHQVNPYRAGAGVYANLYTGAASGANPGALPIDDSVPLETALKNLQIVFATIASIRMPNGVDPRFLRPLGILCSPRVMFRAVQLTGAKFIAMQTAGGGAGPTDVEALIKQLAFAAPIQADELAGFEDDRTYFVVCDQLASSQLGAGIFTEREAYRINWYGPQTDAILNRADEFEWHCKGRNGYSAGHPFLLFKVKGV